MQPTSKMTGSTNLDPWRAREIERERAAEVARVRSQLYCPRGRRTLMARYEGQQTNAVAGWIAGEVT